MVVSLEIKLKNDWRNIEQHAVFPIDVDLTIKNQLGHLRKTSFKTSRRALNKMAFSNKVENTQNSLFLVVFNRAQSRQEK